MIPLGHVTGWETLFWLALAAVLGGLLFSVIRTRLRLGALRRGIERITAGDASHRLPQYERGATAGMSRALTRMAGVFNQRLRSLQQQRNELEAVLASMVEGVIAVDLEENILSLNNVGSELLRVSPHRAIGRSIQEVVRNTALQQFVQRALSHNDPIQGDFVLRLETRQGRGEDRYIQAQGTALLDAAGQRIGALVVLHDVTRLRRLETRQGRGEDRYIQAQGTALLDAAGQRIGALVVLHDVTRLRRLEMIRRDFVANVSHELKTPITAIKGAVETLIDTDERTFDPESHQRFLGIVNRQADRLHAIIEDLLALARIEQDAERDRVLLEEVNLREIMDSAVEACTVAASGREIALQLHCTGALTVRVNPALLEQAVVNLLDNAIKYCPPETTVEVRCAHVAGEAVISVIDQGPGIEAEHLPRIFERFYRTDKARSRAMGGTGLGLSIVKHIANAHNGRVSVESELGEGSTFRIHLPTMHQSDEPQTEMPTQTDTAAGIPTTTPADSR